MHILIIDDHAVLREGLKTLAGGIANVKHIDQASCGEAGLQLLKKNDYDLVILDLDMPDKNGLEILQYMQDFNVKCKTIVLSFHPEEHFASRVFNLGASGYISKNASYDEIKTAIRKVASGGKYIPPDYAERLAFGNKNGALPHESLSEREFHVMLYLAQGKSISEIKKVLNISDKTVSTYRARILEKMQLKNNAELTTYALKNKLIL